MLLLLPAWNVDKVAGASAAILDHEATLKCHVKWWSGKIKEAQVPDDCTAATDFYVRENTLCV